MNESSAMSVMGYVPVIVGVPDRTPPELRLKPGGNGPLPGLVLQSNGGALLVAVKEKVYGKFTAPELGAGVDEIVGGAGELIVIV